MQSEERAKDWCVVGDCPVWSRNSPEQSKQLKQSEQKREAEINTGGLTHGLVHVQLCKSLYRLWLLFWFKWEGTKINGKETGPTLHFNSVILSAENILNVVGKQEARKPFRGLLQKSSVSDVVWTGDVATKILVEARSKQILNKY